MNLLTKKLLKIQDSGHSAVVQTHSNNRVNQSFRQQMDIDHHPIYSNKDNTNFSQNNNTDYNNSNRRIQINASLKSHHHHHNPQQSDQNDDHYCCDVAKHWEWIKRYGMKPLLCNFSQDLNCDSPPPAAGGGGGAAQTTTSFMHTILSQRCEQLQKDIEIRNEELFLRDKRISTLEKNLELKDSEVLRLQRFLEEGKWMKQQAEEEENVKLNLRSQIKQLERQLETENQKFDEIIKRNQYLENELNKLRRTNKSGGIKEDLLRRAEQEIRELREERDRLMEKLSTSRKDHDHIHHHRVGINIQETIHDNPYDKMEKYVRQVEGDRDYWKEQAERCHREHERTNKRRGLSDGKPDKFEALYHQATRRMQSLESRQKILETELATSKEENNRLRCLRDRARSHSHGRTPPIRDTDKLEEINQLKRERDHLQMLLDRFERQLCDIQGNVRVLVQERDNLSRLYEDSRTELQRVLLSTKNESKNSQRTQWTVQNTVKRLEAQREDALTDLRRMTTERDSLRERLHIATERDLTERARLEQVIEDLQRKNKIGDQEKQDYTNRLKLMESHCANLEEGNASLRQQVDDYSMELKRKDSKLDSLRNEINILQRKEKELEHTVDKLENALNESTSICSSLQDKICHLERDLKCLMDENNQLKVLVRQLDDDKDALAGELDKKSEKICSLQNQLSTKDTLLVEAKMAFASLEQQIEQAEDALQLKEREIHNLKKQMDHLESTINQEKRKNDTLRRENDHLIDNVNSINRENQDLRTEIMDINAERENDQNKLQDYLLNINQLESNLVGKEHEIYDLKEKLRSLSLEIDHYQDDIHKINNEFSLTKMDLASREETIRNLECRLDKTQNEVDALNDDNDVARRRIDTLQRSLDETCYQLTQNEAQHTQLIDDLASLRDLCSRVESAKENLHHELQSSQQECHCLKNQLHEMTHTNERLCLQLHQEEHNVENLESALNDAKEREIDIKLEIEERNAALVSYKDRICLQDTKIDQQQRELTRLRSHAAELENDIENLNRQLTMERFEKERIAQDLRRHLHSHQVSITHEHTRTQLSPDESTISEVSRTHYHAIIGGGGRGVQVDRGAANYHLDDPPHICICPRGQSTPKRANSPCFICSTNCQCDNCLHDLIMECIDDLERETMLHLNSCSHNVTPRDNCNHNNIYDNCVLCRITQEVVENEKLGNIITVPSGGDCLLCNIVNEIQ